MNLFLILVSLFGLCFGADSLEQDNLEVGSRSEEIAKLYEMPDRCNLLDITDRILRSPLVPDETKEMIKEKQRTIVLFTYPSDGMQIKGFISFLPNSENRSTIVFLRGGCKTFGIPLPSYGTDFGDMNVIATTYRGGVSEGTDEYGGADINDVKNLIDFIPTLEKKLRASFLANKLFMIGSSRGGMQMFLSLSRFPELQTRVSKVISVAGLLDMELAIHDRPDLKKMFVSEYGLKDNDSSWIAERNPILAAPFIRKDLPILIVQGTGDIRVSADEARHMVEALQQEGCCVEYWEIEGGYHSLSNMKDKNIRLAEWLQS